MNNTVTYENPLRKRLKQAMSVLVVLAILFAVILIILNLINNQTYSGKTVATTGVVKSVKQANDTTFIYLENSDVKYSANPIDGKVKDLNTLIGKTVTLYTPQKQFGNGDPLVFGITVDGVELVNAEKLMAQMHQSNTTVIIIFAVLCGVCAAGVCAMGIARIYIPREKQYPLGQKYVEFYAEKQPNCPETKYLSWFGMIWAATVFTPIIIMSIWNSIEEQGDLLNSIFVGIIVVILIAGFVVTAVLKKWLAKKNLEFYAERYPFDFADISHVKMKKSVREKIEKEMREDLLLHPHYQGDGGNGYLTKFTENGVELYIPDFWNENQSDPQEHAIDAPAEDVFGLNGQTSANDSLHADNISNDEFHRPPVLTLTYDALNFEAVPYFKKPRPLFVVIKSRLAPNECYPEELINDLHFLLDVNLLKTLQTFSVPVENLDNILQNKRELMLQAYAKDKKK